jgi:membrane associated rhomboid family serine protease
VNPRAVGRRTPWLTIATSAVTAVVSVVGLCEHEVVRDLARRGGELAAGEPWRLVTSLLVHDTWLALAANLVFLGVVGTAVERRRGRGEWLTLYLLAGVVGELVGTEWQPHGAGNSVAVMGLVGCLAVTALRRGEAPFLALGYSAIVLMTLLGADIGGGAGAAIVVVAYLVPGACFAATHGGRGLRPVHARLLGGTVFALALALTVVENLHGPPVFTGALVALAWSGRAIRARA